MRNAKETLGIQQSLTWLIHTEYSSLPVQGLMIPQVHEYVVYVPCNGGRTMRFFDEPLLLRLKRPPMNPVFMDSIKLVLPVAASPNTFTLILAIGVVVGISCSMKSSQQDS